MRHLLFVLLLAGCAVPPTADGGSTAVPSPSTPPPPVPPPPPDAEDFLTGTDPVLKSTGDPRVDAFRDRIFTEAGSGWRPYLLRLFDGVRANPEIVARNRAIVVPESATQWVTTYVTPDRIAAGRRLYSRLRRTPPPSPGGAPLEVQLALWGMLSNYGAHPPQYDVIQTYLTLGAYGLSPSWTYFDFYEAASLIVTDVVPRERFKAYEDGRIGQIQILPGEWEPLARDGNRDGEVDLWADRADIFASIGPMEWEAGVPLAVEVGRPKLDPNDRAQARMIRAIEQSSVGVSMFPKPGGGTWPKSSASWGGKFVEPFGPTGPAYILTRNFTPVNYRNPTKPRYWSDDSDVGFGLAVALLADAIAGRPGPSIPIR